MVGSTRPLSAAPLRIGLVGAGYVSTYHLRAWARQDHARVVAIAEPEPAHAARQARTFDVTAVYPSAEALVAAERPDALDVATPRATHAALVRLAARHGIPVLCQKPLAPTLAEARALARDVAGRCRVMVHENWRFRPYYRVAGAWLRAGAPGTVRQVTMRVRSSTLVPGPDGVRPALRRQPFMAKERRLVVAELLIHHLDVLRWLLGPLRVVAAWTWRTEPDLPGETAATIVLETAGRAAVVLEGDMAAPGALPRAGDALSIQGDRAALELAGGVLSLRGAGERSQTFMPEVAYQAAYDAAVGHFVDRLRSGTPFETDLADNLRTLALVEEVYRLAAAEELARPGARSCR